VKAILHLRASVKIYPWFTCHIIWKKSGNLYDSSTNLLRASFVKILVKSVLLHGHKWIYIYTFYPYCTIWVKFSIRDLHTLLLTICKLHENWHRQFHTLLTSVNEMCICARTIMKLFNILKVTSAVYYIMSYSIFNLVIPVEQRHASAKSATFLLS